MDEFKDIELLSELRARFSCFDEEEEPYYRALSNAIAALKSKRKKGEWIPKDKADAPYGLVLNCTKCGFEAFVNDAPSFKFCPKCGADMRDE